MSKDKEKCLLKTFLFICTFGVLSLVLYLHFGDESMKTCWLLKICIAAIFFICFILACVLICSSSGETSSDVCKFDCKCGFVLVHRSKDETISIKSNDLKNLLKKAENGDRLYFFSDDFCIDSEMLFIKLEGNKTKKIILRYEGDGEFLVLEK